jgi:nickel-dependent lactate racemase
MNRRSFLGTSIKAIAGARLIGTAMAAGATLPQKVPALKGAACDVVLSTHEHFGDIEERIDLPAGWDVKVQQMAGHNASVLTRQEIVSRLRLPIGTRTLRELAEGRRSAVITFDDLTRPTPTYAVAPIVVEELLAAGVPAERIFFMSSCGTHRNPEQDEVARKLGLDLLRKYSWANHNTWDNLKEVGATAHGNTIKINRSFLSPDLRITISGVKIHGFAGYGGGAKAILPGVAGFDSVLYNHTVVMKRLTRPAAGQVSLFKNEVRADMDEAARMANVDFSVQIVYNGRRQVCAIFAGDIVEAHREASRYAVKHYQTSRVVNPDIVICNSYPQGTQAGMNKWISTVRPGGTGVLIVQHPQGLSAMHYWEQHMEGLGGKTYLDTLATPRPPLPGDAKLIVYSQYIDKRQMNKFPAGTAFALTWAEVIQQLQARHKRDSDVAVYPYAALQHEETELDR